jgi:integrase
MQALNKLTPAQLTKRVEEQQGQRVQINEERFGKNDAWVLKIYNTFFDLYQVEGDRNKKLGAFGFWLATDSELAKGSGEGVLYGLLRLKKINKEEKDLAWKGFKDGLKDGSNQSGRVSNPANNQDVDDICAKIPEDWEGRDTLICLIRLSNECGARAISCCSIRLEDITVMESGHVRVLLRRGKGQYHWRHTVTLSKESKSAPYLKRLKEKGVEINIKPDFLSKRFGLVSYLAGYPQGFHSFHCTYLYCQ